MKIKVCGMKYPDNIKDLGTLPIHFMGMIFYQKSPRYVENLILPDLKILPDYIKRVGVFVNSDIDFILNKVNKYNLDLIQLHGNESPEFCKGLNRMLPIIKAFSIADSSDIDKTKAYDGLQGYFLFDTKTPQYGGSGQKFDWSILETYTGNTPFFLSGGISINDIDEIKKIKHPQFYGLDLNSKFEKEPGLKDITLLQQFIKELEYEQD
ncbi:phosphoribosylanthranilate isomerase [Dysgonomonas sp. Marseille-P4677]|uniref:phosphoribosylanthranilate isomerase n=1 Tax=Dysgonomonas sp. Marseille-P4677 TaxID=2364790 RepID=UPI0019147A3D|nr:phosphoribosylanthranilate isomerase [Dysgonomonas sp. Marseille-P4677]MBK5720423.1 phosphoribosylanthranilate isomerase [Dysgonomonas sp. Marseille-P4677]